MLPGHNSDSMKSFLQAHDATTLHSVTLWTAPTVRWVLLRREWESKNQGETLLTITTLTGDFEESLDWSSELIEVLSWLKLRSQNEDDEEDEARDAQSSTLKYKRMRPEMRRAQHWSSRRWVKRYALKYNLQVNKWIRMGSNYQGISGGLMLTRCFDWCTLVSTGGSWK